MKRVDKIAALTILLAMVAGYCDTLTFVSADAIFSAHVTGNFILFAFQAANGAAGLSWVKLNTFPVFVLAVMVTGLVTARSQNGYGILLAEGVILTACGLSIFFSKTQPGPTVVYSAVFMTVFAMGMQNTFGKFFARETFGPTTVMTGNVTQASLFFLELVLSGFKNPERKVLFYKQLTLLGSFMTGCLLGAVAGNFVGLKAMILPGLALTLYYFSTLKTNALKT